MSVILMRLSGAFLLNCELFTLTLLFALPLGLVVSSGSMSRCKPLAGLVKTFVWIIRGTPLMLQIIVIYLGFGAGLAVFMFAGFVKSIPIEIEEAAMIDGCTPIQTYFKVVMPIMKPTYITVAILQAMWIWNDYLLPYLVLDIRKYKTIPIAIQYLKGGYGSVDMGAMMGVLVLGIIPIIVFYLACQKHIIEGVVAGAVKG